MQHEPAVPLIGGSAHGQTIRADKNTDEIELDVHTSEAPTKDSTFTESYERRRFDGEEFGEGFECFAYGADDATEQKELARWMLKQPDLSDQF